MELDGDDRNRLIIEAVKGAEKPSLPGAEALKYFNQVKQEIEEIIKKGGIVDLPPH
jgi:hypothetical protein